MIVLRHPAATVVPAVFLGALTESPYLLHENRSFLEALSAFVTESLAFYLYVAYAERLTAEARRPRIIGPSVVLGNLLLATPVASVVAVASIGAIALPTAAASVLVVPGLWLLTRWSLFAPAIVREFLGRLAALRRSSELARGHFELVFLTAAFAVVLEETLADAGSLAGLALTGSETWGQWIGGSVAIVVVLPVASFATALVYARLRRS